MPKIHRPHTYRRHKARNSAVVTIDRRNHDLGPFGSPESHENHAHLIAEGRAHAQHRFSPSRHPLLNSQPARVDQ